MIFRFSNLRSLIFWHYVHSLDVIFKHIVLLILHYTFLYKNNFIRTRGSFLLKI